MFFMLLWFINIVVLMLLPFVIGALHVDTLQTAFLVALFIGVINAAVRPLATLLKLPINTPVLAFLTLAVNGVLFALVGYLVPGISVPWIGLALFVWVLYSAISFAASRWIVKE